MTPTPVRVMLVDDQDLIRRSLGILLSQEPLLEVVGEAASGDEALRLVLSCQPNVALIDAQMPGMDGVQLIEVLRSRAPEVAVLMLTTFDTDAYLFGALRAGARGFLLKDTTPEDLVRAIVRVASGEVVLAGPGAERVVNELTWRVPETDARAVTTARLSHRENQVAALVSAGLTNAQIATSLFLAEGTVRNVVSAVLRKLELRDRTQLAVWAVRAGVQHAAGSHK